MEYESEVDFCNIIDLDMILTLRELGMHGSPIITTNSDALSPDECCSAREDLHS